MTPKGAELAQQIREATEKVYARGYKGLTDAQLDTLRKTLAVIFHNYADY
jgi:DNA-binding MarR family transcriptional regulator